MTAAPRVLNIKNLYNWRRDWRYPRDLPPGVVYIGHAMPRYGLPQSRWANPYKPANRTAAEHARAVARYEEHLRESGLIVYVRDLRGLTLACWCAPLPCHGDALLRLANAPVAGRGGGARRGCAMTAPPTIIRRTEISTMAVVTARTSDPNALFPFRVYSVNSVTGIVSATRSFSTSAAAAHHHGVIARELERQGGGGPPGDAA